MKGKRGERNICIDCKRVRGQCSGTLPSVILSTTESPSLGGASPPGSSCTSYLSSSSPPSSTFQSSWRRSSCMEKRLIRRMWPSATSVTTWRSWGATRTISGMLTPSTLWDCSLVCRYYQNWCRLILTCVLPVGALVFFNTRIFQGIKYKMGDNYSVYCYVVMSRYTHQKATNRAVSGELNLATVLICIVVVFIICHIPRVILNCAEFFMLDQILNCPDTFTPPNWNLCLASVNHALLIVNASINFIIYTSVGDSFKLSLKQKIFRWW